MSKQLYMLLASIGLFGVSSFFRKLAVDRIHPYQLQVVAGAVYALCIPVWLYIISKTGVAGWDTRGIIWGALCVFLGIVATVLLGVLLKASDDPGVIVTLVSMSPAITMVLTVLFLGEELTLNKLVASGLMFAGLFLFNSK